MEMSVSDGAATGQRVRLSQEERRDRSERRIVGAALIAIARRGVAGASLADIGELAGFSRGLPAHLFGNKDRLLAECLRRMVEDHWMSRLPDVGSTAAFDALAHVVRRWTADLLAYPEKSRAHFLMLQEANMEDVEVKFPQLAATIRSYNSGSEERLCEYIVAGQEAGELDAALDPKLEALVIHSTLRGITLRWLVAPKSVDLERFTEAYVARLAATLQSSGLDAQPRKGAQG